MSALSQVEGVTCPSCRSFIQLTGKATAVESKVVDGTITARQVKDALDFKEVEVELTPSNALIRLTGKFTQRRFRILKTEALEFGGTYVKGHFRIPLSNLLGGKKSDLEFLH